MKVMKNISDAFEHKILHSTSGASYVQSNDKKLHQSPYRDNFILSGNFKFLKNSGCVFFEDHLLKLPGIDNMHAPGLIDELEATVAHIKTSIDEVVLDGVYTYALLSSTWDRNIYHFFADVVGKLANLEKTLNINDLIYLIPNDAPKFQIEFFNFLSLRTYLYDPKKIYSGRIVVPSMISDTRNMPKDTINFCMNFSKRNISQDHGDNIYISRSRVTRHISNEEDLVNLLNIYFPLKVIHMEDLKVEDQISLAAKAKYIVAGHGAGCFATIFQQSGCFIEIFSPTYCNECYMNMHSQTNIKYLPYFNDFNVRRNIYGPNCDDSYEIDLSRFKLFLDASLNF